MGEVIEGGGSPEPVNLSGIGTPTFLVTAPNGAGTRYLTVIRSNVYQAAGTFNFNPFQYDTYTDGAPRAEDWYGYLFDAEITFSRLIFQEGMAEGAGGGYFASGTIKVQVRVSGEWTDVTSQVIDPAYDADSSLTYETYEFTFDPITGDGIRVIGDPGGGEHWTSVAVIEVFGVHEDGIVPLTGTAHAKVPTGGSVGTLAQIVDGVRPAPGHTGTESMYNSNDGVGKSEDFWGLTFDGNHEIHYLLFQHGTANGGYLASPKVQVRVSGVWTDVSDLSIGPAYPTAAHPSYQTYLCKFTPMTGDGVRFYGVPTVESWTTCAEVVAYGKAA